MIRRSSPSYRRQKRSNGSDLAFVELNGVRHYLGLYGTQKSRQEYHQVLAEWEANGEVTVAQSDLTIVELAARFLRHAKLHYRRADGSPTGETENFKVVLRPLAELYGESPAAEFGPRKMKTVRARLIQRGLARSSINQAMNRLRRVFKWAGEEELVDAKVYHALQTVRGLQRGRSGAREPDPVKAVAERDVAAIRPHVSSEVWALVELQSLSGARSGELLPLRAVDLDTSGGVWTYTPEQHKTAKSHSIWRGNPRLNGMVLIRGCEMRFARREGAGRRVPDGTTTRGITKGEAWRERHRDDRGARRGTRRRRRNSAA